MRNKSIEEKYRRESVKRKGALICNYFSHAKVLYIDV
ncbi:hypothetical protein NMY3_00448 [Candidatus Nitrosocosmicus oleophilus]|uniref:Uncharacterized protein n=1 Tax=Candidatus Nitrosocosmicus oleophilus TaxID=1353260 RepID=A0A654LWN6_9ARCH|nr:hypothetical protein NMY3_00448 [Candidatus Nitrosocosmicus oleophilus]